MTDRPFSNVGFRLMALMYRFRDLFRPRIEIVAEAGIQKGHSVLDYGCGPGGYVSAVAGLVGPSGRVYALDIHPLAVRMVADRARSDGLDMVETILSDRDTRLPDGSIDVVLLYDIFHLLSEPEGVLAELHRVLRADGVLSFNDHHMADDEITTKVQESGLFTLSEKGERTYTFVKKG